MKPRALDLFCGAGGVTKGLQRAGFHVTGVDQNPKVAKRYCGDAFVCADALEPGLDLDAFDFIWASPPCQHYTLARNMKAHRPSVDLIPQTRALLANRRAVTCIENVPRSPLKVTLKLDGWMFPELKVIRERWFETSFMVLGPQIVRPSDLLRNGYFSVIGSGTPPYMVARGIRYTVKDCRRAMGIDWMSRRELSQAIPPAYAEFIGRAALPYIGGNPTD